MQPLDRIVLAGPDESVEPKLLWECSQRYPFVEWGVLYSPTREGLDRYPGQAWREDFMALAQDGTMRTAIHLCGPAVMGWAQREPATWALAEPYERVQLNFNSQREQWQATNQLSRLAKASADSGKVCVIQHNRNNTDSVIEGFARLMTPQTLHVLYDASGGHGTALTTYLPPWTKDNVSYYTGYAGGIGPDNVVHHALSILDLYPTQQFWLDMESAIRTNDCWDHAKVLSVLSQIEELRNS